MELEYPVETEIRMFSKDNNIANKASSMKAIELVQVLVNVTGKLQEQADNQAATTKS
jgi:hypothetical protein